MTDYNALVCPTCGGKLSTVKDSRPHADFYGFRVIRRWRQCSKCGAKHKTIEIPEETFVGTKKAIAKNIATEILGKYL